MCQGFNNFSAFLHHFVLAKSACSSIFVNLHILINKPVHLSPAVKGKHRSLFDRSSKISIYLYRGNFAQVMPSAGNFVCDVE